MLKVGDQKGGVQSVMEAAGLLVDLPYRIEWSQFPAAAPLLEALNAGAIEVGYAGDAPTTFALAAGIFGTATPFVATNLIEVTGQDKASPAYWLMFGAALGIIATLTVYRGGETIQTREAVAA